jgi:hypothetical protein
MDSFFIPDPRCRAGLRIGEFAGGFFALLPVELGELHRADFRLRQKQVELRQASQLPEDRDQGVDGETFAALGSDECAAGDAGLFGQRRLRDIPVEALALQALAEFLADAFVAGCSHIHHGGIIVIFRCQARKKLI